MALYLANTTKQHWNHCFRPPEATRFHMVQIPSGQQVELGHNWSKDQMEAVIRDLERFGARPVVDANGKMDNFPGLLYSTTKPISEDKIVAGHDAVVEAQEKRSASEATRSALAFDSTTRANKGRGKRLAKVTEVEVKQDLPRNQKPTGNEVNFSVGVSEDGRSDLKLP